MNCAEVKEQLCAYRAAELPLAQADQVRQHLSSCGACRSEARALSKLDVLLARARSVEPSADFEPEFWRRIAEQQRPERRPRWRSVGRWPLALGAAVAAAAVVILFVALWPRSRDRAGEGLAEIEHNLDFYQQFDVIEQMDVLLQLPPAADAGSSS